MDECKRSQHSTLESCYYYQIARIWVADVWWYLVCLRLIFIIIFWCDKLKLIIFLTCVCTVSVIIVLCAVTLQFPSVMKPVLESVSAVSCTCEQTLTEMAAHGPSAEHYNILEVQSHGFSFIEKVIPLAMCSRCILFIICVRHLCYIFGTIFCLRQIFRIIIISVMIRKNEQLLLWFSPVKKFGVDTVFKMFFKGISYSHQGYIYLIKYLIILWNSIAI